MGKRSYVGCVGFTYLLYLWPNKFALYVTCVAVLTTLCSISQVQVSQVLNDLLNEVALIVITLVTVTLPICSYSGANAYSLCLVLCLR